MDMVERRIAILVLLVDQHRMALRERAALGILAGQPHRMTFAQERAEGECLAGRPVDAVALLDRLGARVEKALDRAVDMETRRHRADPLADLLELLDRKAGIAAARIVGELRDLETGPASVEPVGLVGFVAL